MEIIILYIVLFIIIVLVGHLFNRFPYPLSLILVVVGMILSLAPNLGSIRIQPHIVLNIFLPLLIYHISAFSSWKDFKKMFMAIALLSVGHVIFITVLVAVVIQWLIPELGWPLAFVIGAILSPPDDVAIVSIAEKIRLPERVITILEGEGMLNDATALTLFRFSLIASLTHHFAPLHAALTFLLVIIGETIYGVLLGYILGELRKKINNSSLHVLASLLTPFLAYIPPQLLGGSGIIATVATGFVIGNVYAPRFTPEFRLTSRTMWPSIFFGIQSILFLLVGLNMFAILKSVSMIPSHYLVLYSSVVIATIIIGRFFWVYFPNLYIPRLFPYFRRREPNVPWQFPFIVAWAGMRGSVSLAAALAVPLLPNLVYGTNARDFLIFLIFTVILVTLLIQGFSLPFILKVIHIEKFSHCEEYGEHVMEISARKELIDSALHWLNEYKLQFNSSADVQEDIKFQITHYKILKSKLKKRIDAHMDAGFKHNEAIEIAEDSSLILDLIDVEKNKLMELWHSDKINLKVRNKLLDQLDHQARNIKAQ